MDRLDVLNREKFVEQLKQLVENIAESEASVSFAIDGTWGCGKSFVLDMFEEQLALDQSDKYLIVHYNCWKYDYYEEPLIAIVATIIDAIDKKANLLSGEHREKVKGVLKAVGTTLLSIAHNKFEAATGIDTSEVLEAFNVVKSGLNVGKEEYEKMQEYDVFFSLKQTLHSLQDALTEISEQYTLVFLVDELDRCLPEYSIKVLERLHHLTESTWKIINIIAIDEERLKESVQHIFGFSKQEKADKYLKKFIQFSIPLDLGNPSQNIVEKFSAYVSLFDKELIPVQDSIEECMQALFVNIDAREQEQLIQRAMLVHKLLYSEVKDYSFMCVELLIVILEYCYQGKKVFTKWFQKFTLGNKSDEKNIPFSTFLNDKFDKAFHLTFYSRGGVDECALQRTDSLYGAIAYLWYNLFLKNSITSFTSFSLPNSAVIKLLENNVIELEKFYKMIKFMK